MFAGSEFESYLRVLQVAGQSTAYPWSVRGFSVGEVEWLAPRDSIHPWVERFIPRGRRQRGAELNIHPAQVQTVFNSAFPHGRNDGAVWAGRGLTTAVQVGATVRYGPISLTLAPVAFRAENASFRMAPLPVQDVTPFADWRHPKQIDLPQRFGDGAYTQIDWGQSNLRADLGPIALGAATANQVWGPATEYPLVLGTNAPGYAHAFLGTARPLNLWVGKVHGRFIVGRLEQSPYATTSPDSAARFMSGVVGVFTPRGVPGLEIGGGRFHQTIWPSNGLTLAHLVRPFETVSRLDLVDGNLQEQLESVVANQIASLFARWMFPASGLEVYGEFATEDHRHNSRDIWSEPDHNAAYMVGFRKVFTLDREHLWSLRGEILNAEPSHLARGRRQEPFYIHANTRQGHTQRGQVLGSPAAYGGAASTLAADYYHPAGRWTVAWRRVLRQERGEYLRTGEVEEPDFMHGLGAEAMLFRGRWDITAGMEGMYNFNRNFDSDVANLNVTLGVKVQL